MTRESAPPPDPAVPSDGGREEAGKGRRPAERHRAGDLGLLRWAVCFALALAVHGALLRAVWTHEGAEPEWPVPMPAIDVEIGPAAPGGPPAGSASDEPDSAPDIPADPPDIPADPPDIPAAPRGDADGDALSAETPPSTAAPADATPSPETILPDETSDRPPNAVDAIAMAGGTTNAPDLAAPPALADAILSAPAREPDRPDATAAGSPVASPRPASRIEPVGRRNAASVAARSDRPAARGQEAELVKGRTSRRRTTTAAESRQPAGASRPSGGAMPGSTGGGGAGSPSSRAAWQAALVAHIRRYVRSQAEASGTASVRFSVDRAGRILSANLAGGTGNAILDGEAVSVFRRAQPLPPPPADVPGGSFSFTLPIRFAR